MANRSNPSRAEGDRKMFPIGPGHVMDERTKAQIAELERLEAAGVRCMRAFDETVGLLDRAKDIGLFIRPRNGIISEYVRLERAFRQVIILQRELQGLRPSRVVKPKQPRPRAEAEDAEDDLRERLDTATERDRADPRDDWDKLDYQPVGEAVAWIRQAFGAEPPERDPFTPPDSGPARKPETEPSPPKPAAAASAPKRRKPTPMGRLRARLFRTTHFSPPGPMAPLPGITRPAPAPWQPPRGPP